MIYHFKMKHCEKCRTAPRAWREIERRTRRAIICEGCYTAYRHTLQREGWAILPGVVIPSRINAGGPDIAEDIILKRKPAAQ